MQVGDSYGVDCGQAGLDQVVIDTGHTGLVVFREMGGRWSSKRHYGAAHIELDNA